VHGDRLLRDAGKGGGIDERLLMDLSRLFVVSFSLWSSSCVISLNTVFRLFSPLLCVFICSLAQPVVISVKLTSLLYRYGALTLVSAATGSKRLSCNSLSTHHYSRYIQYHIPLQGSMSACYGILCKITNTRLSYLRRCNRVDHMHKISLVIIELESTRATAAARMIVSLRVLAGSASFSGS
jgi:hypothetical protein